MFARRNFLPVNVMHFLGSYPLTSASGSEPYPYIPLLFHHPLLLQLLDVFYCKVSLDLCSLFRAACKVPSFLHNIGLPDLFLLLVYTGIRFRLIMKLSHPLFYFLILLLFLKLSRSVPLYLQQELPALASFLSSFFSSYHLLTCSHLLLNVLK